MDRNRTRTKLTPFPTVRAVRLGVGAFADKWPDPLPKHSAMRAMNLELMHHHIFFTDGSNIGFGPQAESADAGKSAGKGRYMSGKPELFCYPILSPEWCRSQTIREIPFDDAIVRAAVIQVFRSGTRYSLPGGHPFASFGQNCQRFARRVESVARQLSVGADAVADHCPITYYSYGKFVPLAARVAANDDVAIP